MNLVWLVFSASLFAVWVVLVGHLTPSDAVLGALVVGSAWAVYARFSDFDARVPISEGPARAVRLATYFLGYVAPEVARSTWRVFSKVLSPQLALSPAITRVTVPGESRSALVLLAYGISLTPGQQIVAIDEATRTLYVHTTDAPDPEATRRRILAVYWRYLKEEP